MRKYKKNDVIVTYVVHILFKVGCKKCPNEKKNHKIWFTTIQEELFF